MLFGLAKITFGVNFARLTLFTFKGIFGLMGKSLMENKLYFLKEPGVNFPIEQMHFNSTDIKGEYKEGNLREE